MRRALAPWDNQTIQEITDYQLHPRTAGYECLNDGTLLLPADAAGLVCSRCDYTQTWVHGHIANGRWRIGAGTRENQIQWLVDYWHGHDGVGRHLHEWLGLTPEQYDEFVRSATLPDRYEPPRRWNRHWE